MRYETTPQLPKGGSYLQIFSSQFAAVDSKIYFNWSGMIDCFLQKKSVQSLIILLVWGRKWVFNSILETLLPVDSLLLKCLEWYTHSKAVIKSHNCWDNKLLSEELVTLYVTLLLYDFSVHIIYECKEVETNDF